MSSWSAPGRRLDDGLLPGPVGPGCHACREDQIPQGEGLRRWPDPARGQGAGGHGHLDRRAGRLAAQQGPADHRRRRPARAALARPRQLSGLRADAQPARVRRDPGPQRAEVRGQAGRGHERDRSGPRRQDRPDNRRDRHREPGRRRGRGGAGNRTHLPGPCRRGGGRQLLPAVGCGGAVQARGPAARSRGPHVLHHPPARRRLPGVVARAVGRRPAAARVRLDLRSRRRHQQRGTRAAEYQRGLQEHRLPRAAAAMAGRDAAVVGLVGGEPHIAGARRSPADGVQPDAALHWWPAARGRRGRHGEPVQWRGYRLRDGIRRNRCQGGHAGALPADLAGCRARALHLPAGAQGCLRRLLHARTPVRAGDRSA